ncbi:MAG: hypothetical protein LBT01_08125 [Spirochaetaceae bacterium]|jgi:hypothetical protein|nr:hypothetical protein [Spirochaetaceae bacterium]
MGLGDIASGIHEKLSAGIRSAREIFSLKKEQASGEKFFTSELVRRKKIFTTEQARKLILYGGAGAVLLILIIIVIVKISMGTEKKPLVDIFVPDRLREEDLFLPDEPDFLPSVILEQEQKTRWTAEEAEAFWTNPLEYGEDFWRQQIDATLDKLLERVP